MASPGSGSGASGRTPAGASGRRGPTRTRAATRTSSTPRGRSGAQRRGARPTAVTEPTTPRSSGATVLGGRPAGGRPAFTRRALALAVVLAMLVLSYASSLRVWFDQERDIAALHLEVQQRQQRIDDLNSELARWQDPNYVRAQARERLGWVVPGDTGYRVVGPDGQPLGGRIDSSRRISPSEQLPDPWWGKVWGSVQTADHPTAVEHGAGSDPLTEPGPAPTEQPR